MPDSDLPPLIRALLRPDAYPHPVDRVELRQTHISYVFLAGEHVYKIKKPVDFGFLNFSTLGRRRYYCHQEVVLNSRLCSGVYLGVAPVRESGGRFTVGGAGTAVEYAVHMRRLPDDRMMHNLLERGEVTPAMVRVVAEKLAAFHAKSETSPRIARYGDWAIRFAWDENIRQWQSELGQTLTPEQDATLRAFGEAFFARKRDVLQRRIDDLRIRECHSDLRSDAVAFPGPGKPVTPESICILDCVEFNRRIRLVDVARDVGFLAMDLDYRGCPDLAEAFVDAYVKVSGDRDITEIIHFFKAYNACVRGKVEGFLLRAPEVPAGEKRRARSAAGRYFELACQYAESLPPAMLAITCGLPATGKSTVARALSQRGFEVISSDVVRKELAGIAPTDRRLEGFEGGIYAPDFTQRTYEALLDRARTLLTAGRSVVLDASFNRREHRRAAARLAKGAGAQFACLWFDLADEVILRLLEARFRKGSGPSDARPEIFAAQKRRFQRPTEIDPARRITVPGTGTKAAKMRAVVEGLRALSPLSVRG